MCVNRKISMEFWYGSYREDLGGESSVTVTILRIRIFWDVLLR